MSALQLQEKILSIPTLLNRYARPRSETIVFTNGVFDLLHRGHVEYLNAARQLGDRLVIGLNTDESVRRLKGPSRPITYEVDRAIVLAGLACVDAITFFDEDTPQQLISVLLPDVLVKGGDYRPEDIVGRPEVEAAGGRVVVLPFLEGRSTTDILQRAGKIK
ncbi:MAG: D-glycero-beta-D-manno-heptose 1-phosphate adenylyltransferase [Gemmatimonadota bacterium]